MTNQPILLPVALHSDGCEFLRTDEYRGLVGPFGCKQQLAVIPDFKGGRFVVDYRAGKAAKMSKNNLDTGLLYRIMAKIGEWTDPHNHPNSYVFADLVPTDLFPSGLDLGDKINYIDRHLSFLQGIELVTIYATDRDEFMSVGLTAKGQMFVQPELAEFGQPPMLPQVMKSLENRIQVLTYPQEEKDGMLYELRDALSKQVPDVIAKVIVEIGAKMLSAK